MFLDYIELTKPRITLLATAAVAVGFYVSSSSYAGVSSLIPVLIGATCAGAACGVFNQYLERDQDALMERTKNRPLPSGRLTPSSALVFGFCLAVLGVGFLFFKSGLLTGILALLVLVTYILLYTPMKAQTPLCTFAGALPGALPVLMGAAAAHFEIQRVCWFIFALLFVWQIPHSFAFTWMYREDFRRAGFKVLPVLDSEGTKTSVLIMASLFFLTGVSLYPAFFGWVHKNYALAACVLSLLFFYPALGFSFERSRESARKLFLASVIYLPLLLACFVVFKVR